MAISVLFWKFLCLRLVCVIFAGLISAQVNDQLPSVSTIGGKDSSSFFLYQNTDYPRDCSEALKFCPLSISSGVLRIKPDGYTEPFEAYCSNAINSEGWTVILRRLDGSVDFKRNWSEYKSGFGFLSTEFWLGNDKLSFLTNQALYELRIDITLDNGTTCSAQYRAFRISDEWSDYTVFTVGTYESDEACKWEDPSECGTAEECNSIEDFVNFTDCNDVYTAGSTRDDIYTIRPTGWNDSAFDVFCNMSIDGGSWTVIQRRVNGSTDFYRNWTEYRNGFGNLQHEFWLGNEKLHYLTQQGTYEYRVDFVWSSESYYNKYSRFRIGDENNKYKVTEVGSRSGTGGNSLLSTRNVGFSTYDSDNDSRSYNCAERHRSGWWHGGYFLTFSHRFCLYFQSGSTYIQCSIANFNGDYNGGDGEGIFDDDYYINPCNIKYTEMKIRRIS